MTAIKEDTNLTKLKVEDLIGNLQTYKVKVQEREEECSKKVKSIALHSHHNHSFSSKSFSSENELRQRRHNDTSSFDCRHKKKSKKHCQSSKVKITYFGCGQISYMNDKSPDSKRKNKKKAHSKHKGKKKK